MFGKGVKRENRGFSLVELICAVAILAIVSFSIIGFVSISSNSFRKSNVEVDLQYEAQMATNQIKELLVDTNGTVSFDDSTKTFLILNETKKGDGTYEFPAVKIWYDSTNKELLYAKHAPFSLTEIQSLADISEVMNESGFSSPSVLADNVSSFDVDSTVETDGRVKLDIGMTREGISIESKPTIVLRNEVFTSDVSETMEDILKLFDATKVTKEYGRIKSIKILDESGTNVSGTKLEVNKPDSLKFSAVVDSLALGTEYEWKLFGGSGATTSISADGTLVIDKLETASELTLRATSLADTTKYAEVTLDVPAKKRDMGYATDIDVTQKEENPVDDSIKTVKRTYSITVKLTYENEAYAAKGFNWVLLDDEGNDITSRLSKVENKNEFTLECAKADSGKSYTFTAVAKDPIDDISDEYATDSVSINVGDIYSQDEIEVIATITADSTDIVRGYGKDLGITVTNLSNYTVKWTISNYGAGFSEKNSNTSRGKVTLISETTNNDAGNHIDVPSEMRWGTSFAFTVKAEVFDALGESQTSTTKDFTISKIDGNSIVSDGDKLFRGEKMSGISLSSLPKDCTVNWSLSINDKEIKKKISCAKEENSENAYITVDKDIPWNSQYTVTLKAEIYKNKKPQGDPLSKEFTIDKCEITINAKDYVSRGETISDLSVEGIPEYMGASSVKWKIEKNKNSSNYGNDITCSEDGVLSVSKSLAWNTDYAFNLIASICDSKGNEITKVTKTIGVSKVSLSISPNPNTVKTINTKKGSSVDYVVSVNNVKLDGSETISYGYLVSIPFSSYSTNKMKAESVFTPSFNENSNSSSFLGKMKITEDISVAYLAGANLSITVSSGSNTTNGSYSWTLVY